MPIIPVIGFGTYRNTVTNVMTSSDQCAPAGAGNQCRVRLQTEHTDNITGTSMSTPTTVASAAPDSGPADLRVPGREHHNQDSARGADRGTPSDPGLFQRFVDLQVDATVQS
jgi:hypothetical protein